MNTQNQLERAVLGLAMTSQRDRSDLQGTKLEWFTHPTNANTWRIIQALDADGQAVDELTITGNLHYADEMSRRNITVTDLAAMRVEAPVGHVGSTYKRRLREAHDRNLTQAALTRAQQMLDGGESTRNVRLEALQGLHDATDEESLLTGLAASLDDTLASFDEVTPYIPTPWGEVNKAIRGWRPGGLYTIGARPGVGKSLMLQAAAVDLARHGQVVLETMEMSHREVTTRLVSTVTGIGLDKLVGRNPEGLSLLSPDDWETIRGAAKELRKLPLSYGERTRTPVDVREHARAARARGPLAGIFIDYLQLMDGGARIDSRVQELTRFTRQLKQIAMEFDCPVIIASQLNRNAANEHRPPTKSELRDSGSIEQDSDVVLLLHADPRVVAPVVNGVDLGVPLDVIVDKNRQGPEMVGMLRRFGTTATISDNPGRKRILSSTEDTK